MTRTIRFVLTLSLGAAAATAAAQAQDPLGPVRLLYASAEYEEALTAISRLKEEGPGGGVEIDRYRVLCLIALGRSAEADQAIETIVNADPLYQPAPADAAPRVRAAFSEVRQRLLPALVRRLYGDAKSAYDRKQFAEAVPLLEKTLRVLDDPALEAQPELADLRVLASGFLDLTKIAANPSAAPGPGAAAASRMAGVPALPPAIVSDPLVVRQDLPPWTIPGSGARGEFRGAVEVDIDEQGDVTLATIVDSVHPVYDRILLTAARNWKYEPARRNGQAVKSRKRIEVILRDR